MHFSFSKRMTQRSLVICFAVVESAMECVLPATKGRSQGSLVVFELAFAGFPINSFVCNSTTHARLPARPSSSLRADIKIDYVSVPRYNVNATIP